MKLLLIFIISMGLYAAQNPKEPAVASGVYIETNIDYPSDDSMKMESVKYHYDAGTALSLAIGYQMDRWRFELEGNHVKDELAKIADITSAGDLIKTGALANVYYSAYNDSKLVSSIGVGAGTTNIKTEDLEINDIAQDEISENNSFTYEVGISLGYMVTEDWTWTVKYRYLNVKDLGAGTQTFSLGLRYLF